MFKIQQYARRGGNFYIKDTHNNFLHSDGSTISCAAEYWPTEEQAQAVLDKFQPPLPKPKNSLVGKTVTIFDRHHFAVPLKGCIECVAEKDGAYQISFFPEQHGFPNYMKMNHTYFFSEQCEILQEDKPRPVSSPRKWEHGDVFSFETDCDYGTMIYLERFGQTPPKLEYVDKVCGSNGDLDYYLDSAKFLFNIKDALSDRGLA